MKNFPQIFRDVERLTADEHKPLSAMVSQLFQEGGELAEAASITEGHIRHKTLSEPLVGEVADVCQVAISILVRATPDLSSEERMDLFLKHFERKNKKWENVQANDKFDARNYEAIAADNIEQMLDRSEEDGDWAVPDVESDTDYENRRPRGGAHDIEKRTLTIVSEQLGLFIKDLKLDDNFVEDLGADSLDLVELAMVIEDEFEMEISDAHAKVVHTPREIIAYVNKRFGLLPDLVVDEHYDPAADYTEKTGRYLSLNERMQERSLHNRQHGGFHEEF